MKFVGVGNWTYLLLIVSPNVCSLLYVVVLFASNQHMNLSKVGKLILACLCQ
jgi:hypothetical protein